MNDKYISIITNFGCNKRKATEKELDDFMKYRGSLMGKE